jgi:outer membrane protein OmpA-like peptidoglycan-associated protein
MIPRYFRCGDPGQRCPLSVKKDIVKERPEWTCPCDNPNCSDFKDPVPLVTGITGGKPWIVYGGVGVLVLLVLLIAMLGGGDPSAKQLDELKARLAPLESKVAELESLPTPAASEQPATVRIPSFKRSTSELEGKARAAIQVKDEVEVASVLSEIEEAQRRFKGISESIDKPDSGSGVKAAEAKGLIDKLQTLESDGEQALEQAYTSRPGSAPMFDEFLVDVDSTLSRARKFAAGGTATTSPEGEELKKALADCLSSLEAAKASLTAFIPPPDLPFQPAEADLIIAAASDLAGELVAPLISGWSEAEAMKGPEGRYFIKSASAGKILVEPVTADEGFKRLAAGEIKVFFSDRDPSEFGQDLKASRSVAEVIALDAMTFLVHPDNALDTFEMGTAAPLRLGTGPEGSPIRSRAQLFGLNTGTASDLSGEEAAFTDRTLLALSHYHEEGVNLRAKRLAVKPSPEALSLKPSPFTIATEDYRFSFRIVAWTTPNPSPDTLSLIKFCTSNDGQEIVAEQGYVDLRLRPIQGDVPPEILAALGAALGVDRVNSAIRLSTNFRFEVGGSDLDIKAQADLERLPRFVANSYPDYKVVILGFTDSDGGPEVNMPLSKDRAEEVAKELRRSKVDTRSDGLGPAFPVDTNETVAGKAKNRRAEVWVAKP